jgi:tetratricopeptide (TPR) repeat protein
MIRHLAFWFAISSALLAWPTAWSATDAAPVGVKACQSGESWTLGNLESSLSPRFVSMIQQYLGKKMTTVRGFSEALAMRRQAKTPEEKFFSEYWVSRALYGSKMIHVAREGFALLASREISPETAGIQLAAVECLVQMNNVYPSLAIPDSVEAKIPEYLEAARGLGRQSVVWDLATHAAIAKISRKEMTDATAAQYSDYLTGSVFHEDLIQGLWAARKSDHSNAIKYLRAFVETSGMPNQLQRYVTTAHIFLARSYYSLEQYDQAILHFKKVDRKSNDLADSLQELTWAYLMNDQYKEAIGTAITLQAGGLRKTYTPEAPMVMSMAMNEICQYPESVKAANTFKKSYGPIYSWLGAWKGGGETQNLYKLAVQYLKEQGNTPDKIASEWIRSPVFISDQDEINLLFDEKQAAASLTASGAKEQGNLTREILNEVSDIKSDFKKELAARNKEGKPFSGKLQGHLADLRDKLASFRNLQKAAPVWRSVLAHHLQLTPGIEHRLMAEIDTELKRRSERMYEQLDEIAENIQLIEVEIYNGASQDIIWQNAHPDFKKMAKDLGDDSGNRAPASQVWNWGKASDITEEGAEIWEDELGSFKANLPDNCSSKDKYLALKSRRNTL